VHKKCVYASRKGKQMFLGLKEGVTYVKMEKLGKKNPWYLVWRGQFYL